MKINYVGYQEHFLQKSIDNNVEKVYVFNNFNNLLKAKKHFKKSFLQESIFLRMEDLKEKLFPTDKLLLKEEKLTVFFYELLKKEEKEILNIDNYFDVIDLANQFFKFYAELNEYNIDNLNGLKKWQQEKFNIIQKIRKRYIARIKELGYTDKTLRFDFTNYNPEFLINYQNIAFINILNFTPKENELLSILEKEGKQIELFLQLKSSDYNEKKLNLQSVTLPSTKNTTIQLYQTEEDLLQLVNTFSILEKNENFCILDADFHNSKYHNILSSNKIKIDKDISFTETKIYKFLNALYNLLKSANLDSGELRIKLEDLIESCYLKVFRNYYGLKENDINSLQKLADDNFIYFSEKLINEDLRVFESILADIKIIIKLKNLTGFCNYLESLNLEKLNNKIYNNNISQYFDALLELNSIERMNIVSSWNKYFGNRPRGLFLLILKYFQFKQVKRDQDSKEAIIEILNLLTSSHIRRDNIIILNASRGVIPSPTDTQFLLTENQRAKLGLKTSEIDRLEEKYYFFRHLLSSKRAIIISLRNQDENITISSFVETLKLKYDLNIQETRLKAEDYPEIISNIFKTETSLFNNQQPDPKNDIMKLEKEDYPENRFSMGYYKYTSLKDCYYRFFLEHIVKLKEEHIEFPKKLSNKVFGIFVHEIFAEVIEKIKPDFTINHSLLEEILIQKFESYQMKINDFYRSYYREIMLPKIQKSILTFLQIMKRKTGNHVKNILTEWQPDLKRNKAFIKNEITDIYLNGRIDLLINTEKMKYIIDFKTGSGNLEQLDFYSLILNPSSNNKYTIKKNIYNVMDEKFEAGHTGSEKDLTQNIKKELIQFFKDKEYKQIYKSRCKQCNYLDICRVVVK